MSTQKTTNALRTSKKFKNRYNDEYWFEEVEPNLFKVQGELNYWRFGGDFNEDKTGFKTITMADASGGPCFYLGDNFYDGEVVEIIDNKGVFLRVGK